jgi:hypothetical protein
MDGVCITTGAIFPKLQTVRMFALVFGLRIVAIAALCACQCDVDAHDRHLLFPYRRAEDVLVPHAGGVEIIVLPVR